MSPAPLYDDRAPQAILTVIPKKGKGTPRSLSAEQRVVSVTYTDSGSSRSTGIEATLANEDYALYSDPDLRKGAVLGLRFGYPGWMVDAGLYVMKEPRGQGLAGTYTIQANERKRGKMARKKETRVWTTTTRSQAVRQVLLDEHFPASRLLIDETKEVLETITQTGETDWQFCWRQAQLAQFEFYIDELGCHFERPRRDQKPSHLLRHVKGSLDISNIKDFTFEGLGAGIPGRITLSGIDSRTGKPFEVSVNKENAEDYVELAETAGADDPDEGDREEEGDVGNEISRNTGARNEEEARELATALFKANRYGAMKMTLQTIGDPSMRSRRVILVSGLGVAFDGLWWVKTVKHTFGDGYQQEVEVTREGLAKRLKIGGKGKKIPSNLDEQLEHIQRTTGGATHQYYDASRYGVQ